MCLNGIKNSRTHLQIGRNLLLKHFQWDQITELPDRCVIESIGNKGLSLMATSANLASPSQFIKYVQVRRGFKNLVLTVISLTQKLNFSICLTRQFFNYFQHYIVLFCMLCTTYFLFYKCLLSWKNVHKKAITQLFANVRWCCNHGNSL